MKVKRTIIATAMTAAATTSVMAAVEVTQEYDLPGYEILDYSIPERPVLIAEDGTTFIRAMFTDDVQNVFNHVVRLPEPMGFDTLLQGMENLLDDGQNVDGIPSGTSGLDARSIFENYPEEPTSELGQQLMSQGRADSPWIAPGFLNYAAVVLNHVIRHDYEDLSWIGQEELIGNSEQNLYFAQWQGFENDVSVYRCDKAEHDPNQPAYLQANACQLMTQNITYSDFETSIITGNFRDLAALKDASFAEPSQIFQNGNFITEITHDIDPKNFSTAGETLGAALRLFQNIGTEPLVAAVPGGLNDLYALEELYLYGFVNISGVLESYLQFNSEIYYIHDDGFAEQLTFPYGDRYIREFNDKYVLYTRLGENELGDTELYHEICEYDLQLEYSIDNPQTSASQENLGGTMVCQETVKSLPVYHHVILSEGNVFAATISPLLNDDFSPLIDNPFGLPVYVESLGTGERIDFFDVYLDFADRRGLGDIFEPARMDQLLDDYLAEPHDHQILDSGLLENYPLPPENPESYGLWQGLSSEDFVTFINNLKIANTNSYAQGKDPEDYNSGDLYMRSRTTFRFISPDVLLSGLGRFTVTAPSVINGTAVKQFLTPEAGIPVYSRIESGVPAVTLTEVEGQYTIQNPTPGNYTIAAVAPGYVSECAYVWVAEHGSEVEEDLVLLAGDLNNDGRIGPQDLAQFRLRERNPGVNYDLNNDGVVDDVDLQVIRDNLGAAQCDI
jgi:hypothetical protein